MQAGHGADYNIPMNFRQKSFLELHKLLYSQAVITLYRSRCQKHSSTSYVLCDPDSLLEQP